MNFEHDLQGGSIFIQPGERLSVYVDGVGEIYYLSVMPKDEDNFVGWDLMDSINGELLDHNDSAPLDNAP